MKLKPLSDFEFPAATFQRFNIVFLAEYALVTACHGSPKAQNI